MRLLARLFTAPIARLRGLPPYERRLAAVWLVAILCCEVFGRGFASDQSDAWAVAGLVLLAGLSLILHQLLPLRSVAALRGWAVGGWAWLKRVTPVAGLDLRRDPPLVRRFPRRRLLWLLALVGLTGLAASLRGLLPGALRGALLAVSPTLTFALEALLWMALVAGAGLALMVGWFFCHATVKRALPRYGPRQLRSEVLGLLAYGLLVGGLLLTGPPGLLVGCIVSYALLRSLLALLQRRGPEVVWRLRGQPGASGGSWASWALSSELLWLVPALFLLLVSNGDGLLAVRPEPTPISGVLGRVFGSCVGLVLPPMLVFNLAAIWDAWRHNPARPVPTRVHLAGPDARRAEPLLRAAGLRLRRGAARSGDVLLRVGEEAPPGTPAWPLRTSLDALDARLFERLRRRDVIQRRRRVVRGLVKTFKHHRARSYDKGCGFFIAPHLWYVSALTRDEDEDETPDGMLLPPWHVLIPLAARSYLYEVLEGCSVDMLFAEDGITHRQLITIVRMLFEHHAIHAGRLRITERHLFGVRGVRVVIHELGGDEPFQARGYPEPDYEMLGRARILHLFRDRGGAEEEVSTPRASDFVPSGTSPPVLVPA